MQPAIDRQAATDFVEAGVFAQLVVVDGYAELVAELLEVLAPLWLQPVVQQVEDEVASPGGQADRARDRKSGGPEIVVEGEDDVDRAGYRDFGALPRVWLPVLS
jgi:hypothetical protein